MQFDLPNRGRLLQPCGNATRAKKACGRSSRLPIQSRSVQRSLCISAFTTFVRRHETLPRAKECFRNRKGESPLTMPPVLRPAPPEQKTASIYIEEWTDVRLDDRQMWSWELADDIRKSAIQSGKGFIRPSRDLPHRRAFTVRDCELFSKYPDPARARCSSRCDRRTGLRRATARAGQRNLR